MTLGTSLLLPGSVWVLVVNSKSSSCSFLHWPNHRATPRRSFLCFHLNGSIYIKYLIKEVIVQQACCIFSTSFPQRMWNQLLLPEPLPEGPQHRYHQVAGHCGRLLLNLFTDNPLPLSFLYQTTSIKARDQNLHRLSPATRDIFKC